MSSFVSKHPRLASFLFYATGFTVGGLAGSWLMAWVAGEAWQVPLSFLVGSWTGAAIAARLLPSSLLLNANRQRSSHKDR